LTLLGWRRFNPSIFATGPVAELPDDELLLFLRLAFGPHSIAIAGVVVGGRLALAETCRVSPERFDFLFGNLQSRGLAIADWRARLAFFHVAHFDDPPANPNVVTMWARLLLALPPCDVRDSIRAAIEADLTRRDAKFARQWFAVLGDADPTILDDEHNGSQNGLQNRSGNGSLNRRVNRLGNKNPDPNPDPNQKKKPEPAKRAAKRRARESFAPDGAQAAAAETAADEGKLSAAAGLNGRVVQDAAPAPSRFTASSMRRAVAAARGESS
jgi:hypothetical protein